MNAKGKARAAAGIVAPARATVAAAYPDVPVQHLVSFEGGFEVTDSAVETLPAFMKERTQEYFNSAKAPGLVK